MIRIEKPTGEQTLDLGFGVSVTVRPLSTHVYRAALHSSERLARQFAADQGLLETVGGSWEDVPPPHDRDGMAGVREQLVLQCLARHAIIAWTGVAGEDDQPAPVTPEAVDALIRDFPPIADRFEALYLLRMNMIATEGNGSGAAPTGISEAAPSIAGNA